MPFPCHDSLLPSPINNGTVLGGRDKAGKRQLSGDTARQATAPEVKELRSEALSLKECVAELTLENRLLKKSMLGDGEFEE